MPALRLLLALSAAAGASAAASAGAWQGRIEMPGSRLYIEVALVEGTPWSGRISIPSQGLRDAALAEVSVAGAATRFAIPGVPGGPAFAGRVGDDGALAGTFVQNGQRFPFRLTRMQRPALPAGLAEVAVEVGRAPWLLPGTVTRPAGAGPWPAAVLVHGSGSHDRDETVGPSAPFRDLAWGLAQRGVLVLRYEKRAHTHAQAFARATFTVREETIEDAAHAVAVVAAQPGADRARIAVLGHSLGGYLIPRIAAAAPAATAFVVLAGSARPLEEIILEQVRRQGAPPARLAAVEAEVERIRALDPAAPGTARCFGLPPDYWLDLQGYDPAAQAAGIARPMLVLQGDKDCQVTLTDFARWQRALAGRADVRLQRYGDLNHLFMPVAGVSTGDEYYEPGQRVADAVIADIAQWLHALAR